MSVATRPCVLQLAPHPDDEVLGAGGTLLRLSDDGWAVHSLALSFGRPEQHERRRAELAVALDRLGFQGHEPSEPIDLTSSNITAETERQIEAAVAATAQVVSPRLLVAPSPNDGHPAHEVVGRAALRVAERLNCRLWLWGLWVDLAQPTLLVELKDDHIERARHALSAHAGELDRNRYDQLLVSRARVNAVLGPERIFGFGTAGIDGEYAEVLEEVVFQNGSASWGRPRSFEAGAHP